MQRLAAVVRFGDGQSYVIIHPDACRVTSALRGLKLLHFFLFFF